MGTLATVLAGEKIRTFSDLFEAKVRGDIEEVDGVLKITRIQVDYLLKAPKEKHQEAREAAATHVELCPAAQSVIGCIDIQYTLNLEEL